MKPFSIKINNNCNNNCKYCLNGGVEKKKQEIKDLIDKAGSSKILLEGGEPLIYKDIFEIINYILEKKLSYEIKTNARMACYRDFAKKISSLSPNKIIVKFPSFKKEIFEKITRTQDSYNQTLKGLKNLISLDMPVQAQILICKESLFSLKKTLNFLARIGVRDFSFEKSSNLSDNIIDEAYNLIKKMNIKEEEIQTYVQVNTRCNQKCIFCNRPPVEDYSKEKEIKIESIKKRIDEISNKWQVKRLIFTGGEPLLYPKINEIVSYAKNYGFKVEIQTNGTLLTEEKMMELDNAGLDILNFAFHSHKKEISNKLRGVSFGFEKIIENIKIANKIGFEIHIIHVINSLNYKDLPGFIDFVNIMGLSNIYLNLSIVVPEGWAWKNKWIIPRIRDIKPYLQEAMKRCKKYKIKFDVSEIVPLCIMQGFEDHAISTVFKKLNLKITDDYYSGERVLDFTGLDGEFAAKAPQCKKCTFNKICAGFYPRLKELYGVEDFVPRTDDPTSVYMKLGFKGKEIESYGHKNPRSPGIIYINLSEKCNENCVFCVVKGENVGKFGSMEKEEAKKIIKDFVGSGGKSIVFTGGEPTLRNDLPEIISYAEKFKEIDSISIITNGVRLADDGYLKEILAADKDNKVSFCFSLHSHKKNISELLTGSEDTFEKTISGIKKVYKSGKSISFYHVITSKNYKDLLSFCKFLKKNFPKSKVITFAYPFPQGNALNNKWIFTRITSIRSYLLEALKFLEREGYKISIAACGQFPLCAIPGFEETVLKSLDLSEENISGVVGEKSFHEFEMASDEWKESYKDKSEVCRDCIFKNVCQGFWREYIDLFGFDGIKKVTEKNFEGNKIFFPLNNEDDVKKIISLLKFEKVNLLVLKSYKRKEIEKLVDFIKKEKIILIIRYKGENIYS